MLETEQLNNCVTIPLVCSTLDWNKIANGVLGFTRTITEIRVYGLQTTQVHLIYTRYSANFEFVLDFNCQIAEDETKFLKFSTQTRLLSQSMVVGFADTIQLERLTPDQTLWSQRSCYLTSFDKFYYQQPYAQQRTMMYPVRTNCQYVWCNQNRYRWNYRPIGNISR
ncbi:unnamed protein product [Angiostrongylus costaricensis]|uniref:Uncharacterized protein n=1 Tax=Angiostrongylus costaricensis TaxID=334426 RepID=A0A158PD11_ANGCS|nr:unnamed protein product [Angiostrongylus costaricensis]